MAGQAHGLSDRSGVIRGEFILQQVLAPQSAELLGKPLLQPELSLSELAETFDPPLTKSCLNHRMRKLMELAGKEKA